jgi:hypothetical protein
LIRPLVVLCLLSIFVTGAFNSASACVNCKKSPNGWGFCRDSFWVGTTWNHCSESADSFSGKTSCSISIQDCDWRGQDWPYPGNPPSGGSPGGGGGGSADGGSGDCWWTDLNGGCILAL